MKFIIKNINSQVQFTEIEKKLYYKAINDLLTVEVDGAKYMKAFKTGAWDGKKRFLSKDGLFPTGLLPLILDLLSNLEIDFESIDILDLRENIAYFNYDLNTTIGNLKMRDYQVELLKKCNNHIFNNSIYFPRGIINAATNAGKNLIIGSIFKNIENPKLLFMIHNKAIFNQTVKYFYELFEGQVEIGTINDKGTNITDFTVCMVQTLSNRVEIDDFRELLDYFNILIVDECHRAGSEQYENTLRFINAGCRYFFSGTALENESKIKNIKISGMSGSILGKITNEELITKGVSRKPLCHIHKSKMPITYFPYENYSTEYNECIIENEDRNLQIANLVYTNRDKYVLISVEKIKHGQNIYNTIKSNFPDLNVKFISANSKDRDEALQEFIDGRLNVLITSMIIKEGINMPNIDLYILAHGGKSAIGIKQLIGRALRMKQGHKNVEVHDFYDDYNILKKHSDKRINLYQKENFEIIMN